MNRNITIFWHRTMMSALFTLVPFLLLFSQLSEHCDLIGRWAEGQCFAVSADGAVGYYATGGLLRIVDYTNATHPEQLGTVTCNGRIQGIQIRGDYVYLVGGYNGFLKIVDISNPADPAVVGNLEIPRGNNVAIDGNYGYVCCGSKGLYIVDLSDVEHPNIVSTIKPYGELHSAVVKDDIVYATSEYHGFSVINVTDKMNPIIVQDYELEGTYRGIDIYENTLFMGGTNQGLVMYNIGPTLTYLGAYYEEGHAEDVMVIDGIAYVANRYSGIYFLDVNDPSHPALLGEFNTVRAAKIFVNDHYTFVADTWSFKVIDVSDFGDPVTLINVDMANDLTGISLIGDFLYTSNVYRGMHILDVQDPANPEKMSALDLAGTHLDIKVQDTLAFIAGGNSGLIIISVKNPASPWRISSLQFITSNTQIAIQDQYVYAAVNEEGMHIIDVSDPADPTETGFFKYETKILNIVPEGDYAYLLCDNDGVYVIDISDPTNPVEIGHLETEGDPENLMILGDKGYLAEGSRGLTILDLSNPAIPFQIASYDSDFYSNDVAVRGHYAYMADDRGGLRILDIWNIEQIEEVAFYKTGEEATEVLLGDEHIYVADNYDGVYVLQFDSLSVSVHEVSGPEYPDAKLIRSIYPNPFLGSTTIMLEDGILIEEPIRIYDINGHMIRSIDIFKSNPSGIQIEWDGLSGEGNLVPEGLYMIEVKSKNQKQIKQILKVQ
jgi:hypothetical protein